MRVMTTPDWEQLSIQEEEISEIKSLYPGQVKVLCCNKKFQNVVLLNMKDFDINFKFILTDKYPDFAPRISISSSTLSDDQQAALTIHLQEEAELKKGQQMIKHVADSARKWLEGNGFVSAMKTAVDVIKRIQGDSDLIMEDFYIGYIDDLGGIMDKCLAALTSKDIALEEIQTIRQHCIQHIKYKTEVIWDKNKRIDNVFGSTKSNLTITAVIKQYEKKENEEKEEEIGAMEQPEGTVSGQSREEDKFKSQGGNTDRKSCQKHTRIKPNYFLSLDITDENIKRNATEMQEMLVSYLPNYDDYVVPKTSFHITLAVMNLEDADQVSNCSKVLKDLEPELTQMARKVPPVALSGLGTFWDQLIFAKVALSSEFWNFVDFISESLLKGGVNIIKEKDVYTPHLTLIKGPRDNQGVALHWKVQQCCGQFRNKNFGIQKLDAIHLCKMDWVDDKYPSVITIKFE